MYWSALATWTAMPLTLALALLLLALWRLRGPGRGALLLAVLVLAGAAMPITGAWLDLRLQRLAGEAPAPASRARTGIVLGGMVSPPAHPGGWPDLHDSIDRAYVASQLVRAGRLERVLLDGGNRDDNGLPPESAVLRDILLRWGVPATRILIEPASRNTRENAERARALLAAGERPWLITSAWHMARARLEFSCAGLPVIPFPVEGDISLPEGLWAWLPSAGGLAYSAGMLHEWMGLAAASLRCRALPVTGEGA